MKRPLLLDLFCGAGGAAMGYYRAGFDVVGIDIKPQHRYPFPFIQGDALNPPVDLSKFDAIHASPPCQGYTKAMAHLTKGQWPRVIDQVRSVIEAKPYVIENVPGAPLKNPLVLCGASFGLNTYRHRLFESNMALPFILHRQHGVKASAAGHWKPGTAISLVGHHGPVDEARRAMEMPWATCAEISEAIPPAYTEFIGKQLIEQL